MLAYGWISVMYKNAWIISLAVVMLRGPHNLAMHMAVFYIQLFTDCADLIGLACMFNTGRQLQPVGPRLSSKLDGHIILHNHEHPRAISERNTRYLDMVRFVWSSLVLLESYTVDLVIFAGL